MNGHGNLARLSANSSWEPKNPVKKKKKIFFHSFLVKTAVGCKSSHWVSTGWSSKEPASVALWAAIFKAEFGGLSVAAVGAGELSSPSDKRASSRCETSGHGAVFQGIRCRNGWVARQQHSHQGQGLGATQQPFLLHCFLRRGKHRGRGTEEARAVPWPNLLVMQTPWCYFGSSQLEHASILTSAEPQDKHEGRRFWIYSRITAGM